MRQYNHKKIESKWQKKWEKEKAFEAREDTGVKKFYGLIEFPYPSGEGLHVGHIRSNTAMDIIARKRRAEGYSVLYPIGWDAFGLPTENYAIKTGTPPQEVTKKNTTNFRKQLKALGFSFDWSREINTTDPAYYKWTQWIFLKLFEKGLAYKKKMPINWCIDCKIGLANEEVVDGACERCGGNVEMREKEQWMLKITEYADRLDTDLDMVDFLPKIKTQQRNWIGKSIGAEIEFPLRYSSQTHADSTQNNAENDFVDGASAETSAPPISVKIFTTRPDTLFGATFLAISPELAQKWIDVGWKASDEVRQFVAKEIAGRTAVSLREEKEKKGVQADIRAVNPANREEIPVWVVNYVLGTVGTGAIMAVPAHDERDFEFAKKFNLPIKTVIEPIFIAQTEKNLPLVEREAISAIVKHWSEEKYLGLKWKKVDWGTFITGGVEKGQTPEQAAIAEIQEETGYQNLKLIKTLGRSHSQFFHVPKKENRFAHFHNFYFELENGEQKYLSEEEKEKHDIVWLAPEEVEKFLTPEGQRRDWRALRGNVEAYTGQGILVTSGEFSGLSSEEAKEKITQFVGGKKKTTYKLRDWIFSRQRYWGEPIPLVFCEECKKQAEISNFQFPISKENHKSKILNPKPQFSAGEILNPGWVAVSEESLPVELPKVKSYEPTDTGESPLASISKWVNTKCPKCGGKGKRETDVMPNWAGSSWYYIAYCISENLKSEAPISKQIQSSEIQNKLKYWMPVDWYNGGMEHTTLHLLYSRFWHKFLFDIGAVPSAEPYAKRTSHGLILAQNGEKMSKSRGNVVNPDTIVAIVGADALRLYEMFMGPFGEPISWNTDNIAGPRRFIERVFALAEKVKDEEPSGGVYALMHQTIKKVSEDIEMMKFNTAVSQMMIFLNALEAETVVSKKAYQTLVRLIAPFVPHVAEELWEFLGHKKSVHREPWPVHDESALKEETMKIAVQVNGKLRATFEVSSDTQEEDVKRLAKSLANVVKWIQDKTIEKIIYVKGRLVNIVVRIERP